MQARLLAGRFRTIRRLGAGGMASVYLAEDTHLGRKVAIKRVHPERAIDVAPRFRREMRLAASLSHPHLVRLLDAFVDDGAVLLVMEYVEGETLAERLRHGPLELPAVREVLRALSDAVDYLHTKGVIHRDIKPANILVDRGGRVKLTDLGIASAAEATGITTSGSVLGTPAYMAPELFEGRRATPAADVYSLAAVTFEMLTGERAQRGTTVPEIALSVARDAPPDLREHWPEAGALAAALRRGMARRPGDRPSAASSFRAEVEAGLREVQHGRTVRPRRAGPKSLIAPTTSVSGRRWRPPAGGRRARRLIAPLLFVALILLAGATAAIVLSGGGGGDGPTASGGGSPSTAERRTPRASTATGQRSAPAPGAAPSDTDPEVAAPDDTGERSTQPSRTTGTQPSTASRAAPAPSGVSSAPTPDTPEGAVQAFYTRAAAHRYDEAWALATPELRAQLGGYRAFRAQFGTVRSIRFHRADVVRRNAEAATVAIATTATHADRVDRCSGTASAVRAATGGWSVGRLSVGC